MLYLRQNIRRVSSLHDSINPNIVSIAAYLKYLNIPPPALNKLGLPAILAKFNRNFWRVSFEADIIPEATRAEQLIADRPP